jgi:hypothetical protein
MSILKITHNSGFFSCYSKRLEGIIWFLNTYKRLPDFVDSSEQFSLYKENVHTDLTPLYFDVNHVPIIHKHIIHFHNDMQFLDYRVLDFNGINSIIENYFLPSNHVINMVGLYEKKYSIDYNNTCAVFYRGNDKATETNIASHENFILKAIEIKEKNSSITFLVQSDETEFIELFLKEFPESIIIQEVPHMSKQNSSISHELPRGERAEFGVKFFAAVLVVSRCKHLITHSGNCGLWAVLYRGNSENVYQWLNNSWEHNPMSIFQLWRKSKMYFKKLFKKNIYWQVIESK